MKKVICDHAGECTSSFCGHRKPHEQWEECEESACLNLMIWTECVEVEDEKGNL